MKLTKAVALHQLQDQMTAAGLNVSGLGTSGTLDDGDLDIHTYNEAGEPVELPEEAMAVIEAHEPVTEPTREDRIVAALEAAKTEHPDQAGLLDTLARILVPEAIA